jgi:hypothetical protein
MSPEMITWRAVQRCDHDEDYPGVCDFCFALAMAEALVEEDPELCLRDPFRAVFDWMLAGGQAMH